MELSTIAGFIVTAIGTIYAGYLAFRAERKSAEAKLESTLAKEAANADKARMEYVSMLEKQVLLLKDNQEDQLERVRKLEAAEAICQEERMQLSMENARLHRSIEALRSRRRGSEGIP